MARKSPVELHRIALVMHRNGYSASRIADALGLHPGSLNHWLTAQGTKAHWPGNQPAPLSVRR